MNDLRTFSTFGLSHSPYPNVWIIDCDFAKRTYWSRLLYWGFCWELPKPHKLIRCTIYRLFRCLHWIVTGIHTNHSPLSRRVSNDWPVLSSTEGSDWQMKYPGKSHWHTSSCLAVLDCKSPFRTVYLVWLIGEWTCHRIRYLKRLSKLDNKKFTFCLYWIRLTIGITWRPDKRECLTFNISSYAVRTGF